MIKKCVVCGAEFSAPPSSKKITCSSECKRKRRSELLKGHKVSASAREKISAAAKQRGYTENLTKGTAAAMSSIKAGRNEKNSSAKTYILIAPNGERVKVTNLREWIRKHIGLFGRELSDENVNRVASGFYTIKRNIRRNHTGQTYYGWSILDWDDRKNCEKRDK